MQRKAAGDHDKWLYRESLMGFLLMLPAVKTKAIMPDARSVRQE